MPGGVPSRLEHPRYLGGSMAYTLIGGTAAGTVLTLVFSASPSRFDRSEHRFLIESAEASKHSGVAL